MNNPHVNEGLPGSPGGFIEAVKRSLVSSIRATLTGSGLSLEGDGELHVDMEYPFEKTSYPAAWVQFSFTSLQDSGLGHRQTKKTEEGDESIRQWMYGGRVTVTLLSLSSLDRDRIADKLISVYSFSGSVLDTGYTDDDAPSLLRELNESPYVSFTLKSGILNPNGQSTSVGTPWDPDQLVYEDSYSFELSGEFQTAFSPARGYYLKRIDLAPKLTEREYPPGHYV